MAIGKQPETFKERVSQQRAWNALEYNAKQRFKLTGVWEPVPWSIIPDDQWTDAEVYKGVVAYKRFGASAVPTHLPKRP